jgi:hypothetical protein
MNFLFEVYDVVYWNELYASLLHLHQQGHPLQPLPCVEKLLEDALPRLDAYTHHPISIALEVEYSILRERERPN